VSSLEKTMLYSGAHYFLEGLAELGIGYVFCNLGTDHVSIIEALARWDQEGRPHPQMLLVPHENVAMHMVDGFAAVTGHGQVVLVHVDAGTANAAMGMHNMFRGRLPVMLVAGKAPYTLRGELPGSRDNYVHFVQEPFDMASLVRPYVKWDYSLPSSVMAKEVFQRGHSVMQSDPPGPVYLTLPREMLAESIASDQVQSFSAERYGPVLAGGIDNERAQAIAAQLLGAPGPMIFNHAVYAKLPYAPQDFTPISIVSDSPLVLLVNINNPAKTVQELVNQSKQNPEKANYAASSASFQLITELFNKKTGAKFSHIPYKGANDSVTAVMAGDVTMALADAGPASVGLQSGRLKALAVTSAVRMKDFPAIPTLAELGIDIKVSLWIGLLAPAGTPGEIIKMLQGAVGKVIAMPDVQKKISDKSVTPMSNTSEEFSKIIASEIPIWKQLAIDNNITIN
jgi:tripartite-type tricarboxylate transporter receptor subunit TctC